LRSASNPRPKHFSISANTHWFKAYKQNIFLPILLAGCELKENISRLHTGGRYNILYDYLLFVQACGLELPKTNIQHLITTKQKWVLNL
jgi:hypothetical protein